MLLPRWWRCVVGSPGGGDERVWPWRVVAGVCRAARLDGWRTDCRLGGVCHCCCSRGATDHDDAPQMYIILDCSCAFFLEPSIYVDFAGREEED